MRELLRSHSVSYAEGLRIALEADGIECVLLNRHTVGFDGYAGRVRLMIARDADFDRARALLQELSAANPEKTAEARAAWRLQRLGCAVVALGVLLLIFGSAAVADLKEWPGVSPLIAYGLVAGAVVVSGLGLVVILFGPRWAGRR